MQDQTQYTLKWLFFSFSGRIRRLTYVLSNVFFIAVYSYVLIQIVQAPKGGTEIGLWGLVLMAMLLASLWASAALSVKRLHDMGFSGLLVILVFVPMISMIFFVALAFWPGVPGANQFGPSPIPGRR